MMDIQISGHNDRISLNAYFLEFLSEGMQFLKASAWGKVPITYRNIARVPLNKMPHPLCLITFPIRNNIIEITPGIRYNPPSVAAFAAIASFEYLEIWQHKMLMRSIQSRLLHKNHINIVCLHYGKKFI